jgi:hypothetical protein
MLLPFCVALAIVSTNSSARADSALASNIPSSGAKSDGQPVEPESATSSAPPSPALSASPGELPLPYEPWQGTSFGPPRARAVPDRPLPFARSPELRRRPYEVTLAPGLFLPGCGDGSIDARGCSTTGLGSGIEAAALYRAVPFFAVGGEALFAGFGGMGHGALSSVGGGVRFFGVVGRAYFADTGPWDPYASLSIGYGVLELGGDGESPRGSTSGWGGRVAGGIDYVFSSHWRFGPTLGFAHLLAWSEEQCQGDVCTEQALPYGRLVGFTTFGVRLSGSFGAAL